MMRALRAARTDASGSDDFACMQSLRRWRREPQRQRRQWHYLGIASADAPPLLLLDLTGSGNAPFSIPGKAWLE